MNFHVGHIPYTLVVSDRAIFDPEGNELDGCVVEGTRLLVISYRVEPVRREEIAREELAHAYEIHFPAPRTNEERARLAAMIGTGFDEDVAKHGGVDALLMMQPQRVIPVGRPAEHRPRPRTDEPESMGISDVRYCRDCGTGVACGSIDHGRVEPQPGTNRYRIARWFRCCGLQCWYEYCTAAGEPLGEFVSIPKPQVLYGPEASRWVTEHSSAPATV